ncbi:MAG: hypothetical protein ABIP55_12370 [Tepidisphaeraceae bacterium]
MTSTKSESALPLIAATAPDGGQLLLTVHRFDDSCVLYRNGERIFAAKADAPGIDAAVDLLMTTANPDGRKLTDPPSPQ